MIITIIIIIIIIKYLRQYMNKITKSKDRKSYLEATKILLSSSLRHFNDNLYFYIISIYREKKYYFN